VTIEEAQKAAFQQGVLAGKRLMRDKVKGVLSPVLRETVRESNDALRAKNLRVYEAHRVVIDRIGEAINVLVNEPES
jgi:hypothetical protein